MMNSYQEELVKAQAEGYVFSKNNYASGRCWEVWTIDQWGSEKFIVEGVTLSDVLTNFIDYKETLK